MASTSGTIVLVDREQGRVLSPLGSKIAASSTGAISTALLMTPFDVLKTRMQTASPQPTHHQLHKPPSSSYPLGRTHGPNLSLPATPAYLSYHPHSANLSLAQPIPTSNTFLREIQTVLGESTGVRGLWKGTGTSLLMSVPSATIYMVGYEYLVSALSHLQEGDDLAVKGKGVIPFTAGCLARTVSATVISPLELFRTRLQALPSPGQPAPTYASTFGTILTTVSQSGPTSLWRGLGPTLLRDVPFSGLYWAGFEFFKKEIITFHDQPRQNLPLSETFQPLKLTLPETFAAGATSGMLASLVTHPFDVLKTRIQVIPSHLKQEVSAFGMLRKIVKEEGLRRLFAGVGPRTAKVAPACGLMIGCYEGVGRILGDK